VVNTGGTMPRAATSITAFFFEAGGRIWAILGGAGRFDTQRKKAIGVPAFYAARKAALREAMGGGESVRRTHTGRGFVE